MTTTTDTADKIVGLIQSLLPGGGDTRPAKFRAGPAGTGSGAYCATRADARAAVARHNEFRAAMIARGAMTARAPRWRVWAL